jgi:hypothetical protein
VSRTVAPSASCSPGPPSFGQILRYNRSKLMPIWPFRQTVKSFSYLELKGRVDLASPEVEFVIFEDCKWNQEGEGGAI